ncbi:hypothetical protein E1A91_D02G061000v1 [Gossypium mustelinum]|uniref:Uncharacterized protein n=3 Tax=Gossypium TaxID=3633 RepID=A0A5D2VSE5_GOSMU|nr:hypothetical protein ES288_D02G061000v1 [Gossypium darwinii]TYH82505.1 hypothetical protein ES332_D02G065800v1 [Gossypium tomentosum]TYI92318.1 hypothetical protein E1A91_D02G061000v1 [Gossypium mustelinum]
MNPNSLTLSVISQPGTKADCIREITPGKVPFSLLANTFDRILYKTLHKAIGRRSFIQSGLFILQIKTIVVSFIESWNAP